MGGGNSSSSLPIGHPGGGGSGGKWSGTPNTLAPNTLREALGQKGRPMSMMKAAEGANPYFDKTGTYREFTFNCQRCVVANEARRRGYDVVAQPTYEGDKMGAAAYVNPNTGVRNSYWMGSFQGAKPEKVGKTTATATQRALESKMAEYGNGSRAVMQVQWKGGNGHVISVERKGGKTYYVDPQDGTRYRPKDLFGAIKPRSTQITRVDNLKFSDRAKKMVETRGSRTNNK